MQVPRATQHDTLSTPSSYVMRASISPKFSRDVKLYHAQDGQPDLKLSHCPEPSYCSKTFVASSRRTLTYHSDRRAWTSALSIMRSLILVVLALTGYTIAKPLALEKRHGRPNGNSTACAQVSSLSAAQSAATPTVPAKLAYDCITSVPLNKTAALALIDTARPYFEWQSTLAYLKDPPAEYVAKIQNGVDVFGELASIEAKVSNGSYTNEYEFGFAFYELLQSTHDGHFVYVPDSVGEIFNFGRTLPLVSVSDDGVSLPKVYAYPDVLASSFGNATFKPSEIVKIDGQKATTWLENWAQYGSLQDRDALYNNVFYELAIVSLGTTSAGMGTFTGGGRGRWVYPGDTTTLKFANGTHLTLHNFAKVLTNFTGVTDGESLYKLKFTYPQDTSFHNGEPSPTTTSSIVSSASSTSSAAATSTAATTTPAPGYPSPIVRQINNLNGGYFLEGAGYEDVAVLNAASFVGTNDAEISFQNTNREFIQKAKAAGKTKLIVDVSANGGGTILQGYDLFKQLFPTLEAFAAADRARAIEAEDLIGQKFSEVAGQVPRVLNTPNDTLLEIESDIVSSNLNYRTDEKPDGTPFTSRKEKFGPISEHGDNYTNLFRWNLSDVLTPLNSGGINITGYNGYYTNLTQPFAAENVIVMTDGYCASTCTIFSALMRDVAGVKYVAMGGRSRPGISQGNMLFPSAYNRLGLC